MSHVWYKSYEPNVPHTLPEAPFKTIPDVLDLVCAKFADKPFATCMGQTTTYKELGVYVERFAAYLQKKCGVKPGDRVAIMLPNVTAFFVAFHAVHKLGAVAVCTNPLYTPREMEHQFSDSGATVLVVVDIFLDKVEAIEGKTPVKTVIRVSLGDFFPAPKRWVLTLLLKLKKKLPRTNLKTHSFREILAETGLRLDQPTVNETDIALLQYTGGTTGGAKGAILTHKNLVSNTWQIYHWLKSAFPEGKVTGLVAMPLYHIASLTFETMNNLLMGQHLILVPQPIPIQNTSKLFNKYPIGRFFGVNTFINALNRCPIFQKADKKALTFCFSGGTSLLPAVAKEFQKLTGVAVTEAYGLSEASPFVTCNPLHLPTRLGSIGIPLPSTEICIFDPDGKALPPESIGEIAVRGPQVMQGYWKNPSESADSIRNGWLWTGDIGRMDNDGYIYVLDRRKDMILVSGFNVYPVEVESVLVTHPKVLEAAVVGVKDDKSGEMVKAFIVKRDPSLTEEELRDHCRRDLTNYKQPRLYEFRETLPKTPVGKILRRELRS